MPDPFLVAHLLSVKPEMRLKQSIPRRSDKTSVFGPLQRLPGVYGGVGLTCHRCVLCGTHLGAISVGYADSNSRKHPTAVDPLFFCKNTPAV